jgi:hypothetical protein
LSRGESAEQQLDADIRKAQAGIHDLLGKTYEQFGNVAEAQEQFALAKALRDRQ